jgi:hypothetical protein
MIAHPLPQTSHQRRSIYSSSPHTPLRPIPPSSTRPSKTASKACRLARPVVAGYDRGCHPFASLTGAVTVRHLTDRVRHDCASAGNGHPRSTQKCLLQIAEGNENQHGAKDPERIKHDLRPSVVAHILVILVQLNARDR